MDGGRPRLAPCGPGPRFRASSLHMFRTPAPSPTAPARVYLSPHPDDAVLSSGGAIAAATRRGEQVLVITACSGAPPPGSPLSPYAQRLLAGWGLPDALAAAEARRAEDLAAARAVGADVRWLDLLDAIFRDPDAYSVGPGPFRAPAPGDPLAADLERALAALLAPWPQAPLYAPLGVGQHVDHEAAHAVAASLARAGRPVFFYEDQPYTTRPGALDERLRRLDGALARPLEPVIEPLDEAALAQKIAGVACYAGQIAMLFGGLGAMAETLTHHAASLSTSDAPYGERLWASGPA